MHEKLFHECGVAALLLQQLLRSVRNFSAPSSVDTVTSHVAMVMVPGVNKHHRTGSVWPVPMVKVVRSLPAVQDCRCRRTHSHAPGTVPAVRSFRTSRPPARGNDHLSLHALFFSLKAHLYLIQMFLSLTNSKPDSGRVSLPATISVTFCSIEQSLRFINCYLGQEAWRFFSFCNDPEG